MSISLNHNSRKWQLQDIQFDGLSDDNTLDFFFYEVFITEESTLIERQKKVSLPLDFFDQHKNVDAEYTAIALDNGKYIDLPQTDNMIELADQLRFANERMQNKLRR